MYVNKQICQKSVIKVTVNEKSCKKNITLQPDQIKLKIFNIIVSFYNYDCINHMSFYNCRTTKLVNMLLKIIKSFYMQ